MNKSVLITCPKCGRMIAGRLWRCPECGGSETNYQLDKTRESLHKFWSRIHAGLRARNRGRDNTLSWHSLIADSSQPYSLTSGHDEPKCQQDLGHLGCRNSID
jgi:hypothetical protein